MSGLFKGKSSTVTQEAMLTPEQKQMQAMLAQLAGTGQYGDINLGDAYTGSLGDFNMTNAEQVSSNGLMDLLSSASGGFDTARNTLTKLTDTNFNPDDPSSGYAAYARQVSRATQDANDVLNREAAITGDRYSTSIGRNKADLALRQSDTLAAKLGELYNAQLNRAGSAASALGNLETQDTNNRLSKLNAGFNLGSLQRLLNTAKAQADYAEFNRQREEKLSRIGIGENVFGRNVNYGLMSATSTAASPFSQLLNAGLTAAGTAFGGPIGGAIANGASGLFSNLFQKQPSTQGAFGGASYGAL